MRSQQPTAIITGAAGGLGLSVTSHFLQAGYRVVATIRPGKQEQQNALEALPPGPGSLEVAPLDATNEEQVKALVQSQAQQGHRLQATIMLVGAFAMSSFEESSWAQVNRMIEVNAQSTWLMAQASFGVMKKQGGGRMVMVGAKAAQEPAAATGMVPYTLSKQMVAHIAEHINHAGKGCNVVASLVVPSIIDTPANRAAMPDADTAKWVKADELAALMVYACSEEAAKLDFPLYQLYGGL